MQELDSVLRKIKNRKAARLGEITPEEWKTREFDDILLRHCNTLPHSLEQALAGIRLHLNANNTKGWALKLVDKFSYVGSRVSSTEKDINMRLTKAWRAIDRLSVIWKSDLTDKIICSFFQAAVVSTLLYGCSTWTLTKRIEKKIDGTYTRMLRAILNKSQRQHPSKRQLYGHLLTFTKISKLDEPDMQNTAGEVRMKL